MPNPNRPRPQRGKPVERIYGAAAREPASGDPLTMAGALAASLSKRLMTDRATAAAEGFASGRGFEPGLRAPDDFAAAVFDAPSAFGALIGFEASGLPGWSRAARAARRALAACAACTFFRACFAAFLLCFAALRAFLSSAFARRTCCFASSAHLAAFFGRSAQPSHRGALLRFQPPIECLPRFSLRLKLGR